MPRQKQQPPVTTQPIDAEVLDQDSAAAADLGQSLIHIDAKYGDGLPFELGRYEAKILLHKQTIGQSALEMGRCLIVIKEHAPKGDFHASLTRMGIEPRSAQRFMQAAAKYTERLPEAKAERLMQLGYSKLLELITVDDEDLEALADGGTVAGLTLDVIDTLTVSELRHELRKEKTARAEEAEVKERLLTDKNSKIDKLAEELARRDSPSRDDAQAQRIARERALMDDLQLASFKVLEDVQCLAQAVANMLADHPTESQMTAAETTVQWLFQRVNEVALEHGIPVDFQEMVTPSWAQGVERVTGMAREQ